MRLFDTHCHLQDPAFGGDARGAIARAAEAGVAGMVVLGYDTPSNVRALELAADSPIVLAAVGYHPHEAGTVTLAMLAELEAQVAREDVVAVGEIGLDFYRDHSTPDDQRRVLAAQLEIALRQGKPVCVHSRGAEGAAFELLTPYARAAAAAGSRPGIMHCFGGTLEQALRYVELGFLVSIACAVTYPKNDENRRIARELPLEALVIETDSPYLPPQGRRGERNEPANVRAAAEAIAAARGARAEHVAEATARNAEDLFGVGRAVGAR